MRPNISRVELPSLVVLAFHARAFVDEREIDSYRLPVAVVLVTVVAREVSAVWSASWTSAAVPSQAGVIYATSIGAAALFPTVTWIGLGVGFHVVAVLSFVESDLRDVIWMTGAGMVPYALSALVSAVVTALVLTEVPEPQSAATVQLQSVSFRSHPLIRLANYLHVVFLLWCGAIWTELGSGIWETSRRRAVSIVAGPFALLFGVFVITSLI